MMRRGLMRNWLFTRSTKITVIWFISALLSYSLFQMAVRNSETSISISNTEKRSKVYAKMANDLDENGPMFLKGGETSQSLSLSDLFTLKNGNVTPILKAANPPVRANVLYLSTEFSVPISEAVKNVFQPFFEKAIWFQNTSMYHFSMFHASNHKNPVPAREEEIEAEATAVKAAIETVCPLHIILDRVVLTSTGVLLGCWQVLAGTDPVDIRARLRASLPHAPKEQLYNEAMLHTSFARVLGHPMNLPQGKDKSALQIFHELVSRLNNQIQGLKATVSELWYVEEYELLALALNGKMKIRKFQIGCLNA